MVNNRIHRCEWCTSDRIYINYHDREWGVPVHSDRKLFEFLSLEGAQAGLSWLTILKKRAAYREAFDGFDFNRIAEYDGRKIRLLLGDKAIIRNRLKINSIVNNATAFICVRGEFGTFNRYIWSFVNNEPLQNNWKDHSCIPATTPISDELSRDLKRRGFSFVGSTICYALMQAIGMVNDHTVDCFRHHEIAILNRGKKNKKRHEKNRQG